MMVHCNTSVKNTAVKPPVRKKIALSQSLVKYEAKYKFTGKVRMNNKWGTSEERMIYEKVNFK